LRQPAHPSISEEQISRLVDEFYAKIQTNERLGPIFTRHVGDNWPPHLEKMKSFWRSVLLKTGEYKGKPVPVHSRLTDITTQDFELWLTLFRATVKDVFAADAQPIVIEASRRIASSLWLARSDAPFATPPNWGVSNPETEGNET